MDGCYIFYVTQTLLRTHQDYISLDLLYRSQMLYSRSSLSIIWLGEFFFTNKWLEAAVVDDHQIEWVYPRWSPWASGLSIVPLAACMCALKLGRHRFVLQAWGGKHKYTTITASRVGIRDEDGEIDQTQSLPPVFQIISFFSLKNLCALCFCLKPFTKLSEKEGRKHFDSLRGK